MVNLETVFLYRKFVSYLFNHIDSAYAKKLNINRRSKSTLLYSSLLFAFQIKRGHRKQSLAM